MPDVIVETQGSASSDTLADIGEDREEFVQLEMRTCDGGCRDVFTMDQLTTFDDCRHAVCGLCLTELTIMETPSGSLLCPIGPCRHGNVARNVHAKLEYMFIKQVQYEQVLAEIRETTTDSDEISSLPTVTLSSEETGLSSVSSYLTSSEMGSFEDDYEGDLIDPEQSLLMSETMTEASDTSNDIYSTTEISVEASTTNTSKSIDNALLEKLEALSCATAKGVTAVTPDERTLLVTSESLMSSLSNENV